MKNYGMAAMIGGLIVVLLFVVIFVAVIPTVANQVIRSSSTTNSSPLLAGANVTGATATMTDLITLIFVAVGIVAIVKFIS